MLNAVSEPARLRALQRYAVLGTPPEPDFDDIAQLAARCCDAPVGIVALVGSESVWLKATHGLCLREVRREGSPFARALEADGAWAIDDARSDPRQAGAPLLPGSPEHRFFAASPMVAPGGLAIGAICALAEEPRALAAPAAEALQALARRAVGLLELRVTSERWRTLLEINNAIIGRLDLDGLLQATWQALRRVVPFERSALTLHQPERDTMRIYAFRAVGGSIHFNVGMEIPREGSPLGWVFDHQKPFLNRDLEREHPSAIEARLASEGVRSLVMVPLIAGGRSLGTLNIGSYTPEQYDEGDASFLQEAACQVALAVANAQAYEQIRELESRLRAENVYLREEISVEHNFSEIVGTSPALREALRRVEKVAPTDSTVLVYGETGTGKELFARAIHAGSPRHERPLVKVNCGAIAPGLVESELFGHVKGAFTGAIQNRVGRFELAHRGTIFLDEVSELPADTQVKLLRVLQEGEFEPVGSSRTVKVDVRVIVASNRRLEELVRSGKFRSDLLYRLDVFPVDVPPLRERRSDIPLLVSFFVGRQAARLGKPLEGVSRGAMERMLGYTWPGNVRELQNAVERGAILAQGPTITDVVLGRGPAASGGATLVSVERTHILQVLEGTRWVVEGERGAAAILGLHPNTLRSRMKKLGIERPYREMS